MPHTPKPTGHGPRINIVGTTGSGKSRLAHQLAKKLNLVVIELDDLKWNPGWQQAPEEVFRSRITKAKESANKQGRGWVMAGNYKVVEDITRREADTIIWLDYPLLPTFWYLLKRSIIRAADKTVICNGNTESWRQTFLTKNSILWWFVQSAPKSSARFLPMYSNPHYAGKSIIRLRSRNETTRYLASL